LFWTEYAQATDFITEQHPFADELAKLTFNIANVCYEFETTHKGVLGDGPAEPAPDLNTYYQQLRKLFDQTKGDRPADQAQLCGRLHGCIKRVCDIARQVRMGSPRI
jgi:hypothetical protein